MKPPRWTVVIQSAYDWEREALEFLREHLPDYEPWRAWSNFEFVDDEGRVNEVDLLVLSPAGLILIEIKSRPGTVDGDARSWSWTTDGRRSIVDNPLLLANRKAKRLASVLTRQQAFGRGVNRAPWVTEAIFLFSFESRAATAYRSRDGPPSFSPRKAPQPRRRRHHRCSHRRVRRGPWAAGIGGR
jgi:hypothetical protein